MRSRPWPGSAPSQSTRQPRWKIASSPCDSSSISSATCTSRCELLINYQELSYTEWTAWLVQKITPDQLAEWAKARPATWADESAAIRDTIYPDTQILSWDYAYQTRPILRQRLSQGGVRLAAYLNAMFETAAAPAVE